MYKPGDKLITDEYIYDKEIYIEDDGITIKNDSEDEIIYLDWDEFNRLIEICKEKGHLK
jgi:hypothetical protein